MHWLWFLDFVLKLAEPMFVSPLPPLTTSLSFLLSSPDRASLSSAYGVWQARPIPNCAPSSEIPYLLDCHAHISIPVEGEQWKEEMEFISSVAGIADNQVQN